MTLATGLKPYPAYRDSGVPRLGPVPQHWEVARLGHAVDMRVSSIDKHANEGEVPVRLCNYVDVYKNERITSKLAFMAATAQPTEVERFRLKLGDVLITKDSETWTDIAVPALVKYAADDLVCGYHLALLRPRQGRIQGAYLLRALQSRPLAYQFHVQANGVTRYGLSHGAIKSVGLPLPPTDEQAAVVTFLDHVDRRIARYIRAQQKLIALLNEQKQAIIHSAVTRGLDPNVPLKPSGVEWLRDVPKHWVVRAFTRCAIERADYRGATPTKTESGVFLVTAKNIRRGWIDYETSREFVSPGDYGQIMRRGLPRRGDLLLTTEAPLGNAALVDREDVALAQRVIRFRLDPRLLVPEFALNAVLSPYFQNQLLRRATGSTAAGIKASKLPQLSLVCPPRPEQERILERLSAVLAPLERQSRRASHVVGLVREYRTRLVADVVTGKLDVREAAARLPQDEGGELEALEPDDVVADTGDDAEGDVGPGAGTSGGGIAP